MREESTTESVGPERTRWTREERGQLVSECERAEREEGISEREFARRHAVPRWTLRSWKAHKASLDADPGLVAFFESPLGLAFLHRQVTALHFVFGQLGPCGADLVCEYLRLTGMDQFVAASHGTHHGIATKMEAETVAFGQAQRAKLAPEMRPRQIVVCEDETFHPEVCLVSMEPTSGFILLEEYAANREAKTWTAALDRATDDLNVEIVAASSDEGTGLVSHIKKGLGVIQGPDLFHMQRELWKALSRPLARSLKAPSAALEKAAATTALCRQHKAKYEAGPRPPGRPPAFDKYIAAAEATEAEARAVHDVTTERQSVAQDAIRSLSTAYHPVDLESGGLRHAETVEQDLRQAFATIDETAEAIGLAVKCQERVEKARRVLPKMVAMIAFFHAHIERRLAALAVDDEVRHLVHEALIPGLYLARLASRAHTVKERRALQDVSQRLLGRAHARDGPIARLPADLRSEVEQLAADCAALFVRGTSCVEGRNGRLALWHHSLHRLSDQKLAALQTTHNYYIRRRDRTTAAQRFFEAEHDDLFEWLLDHLDVPARPRSRRRRAA